MSYTKTNWVDNTTPIDKNNLNKIESGIKNNDINIGEENYDNTKTYEVGDIVRYNEKIYKCITAITTAENFDISKWEQTNIVEIVQSEKSKIYELIEAISTPIVGEGENITLNDTAEKRFENFDIEGNSEQEASPSPDYPSEVESCGDNINLFDKNDITNNTSIDVRNGNTYTDNNSFSTNFIKINGITELCCNGLSDTSKLWGAIYDENKSFIKGINTTNGIFNETNLSGATYIRLGLLKTYLDTMKLEKGSIASPFSPYGQGSINVVICNKNLFNISNNTVTASGLTAIIENGIVSLGGTSTSTSFLFLIRNKLSLKAGTYTISTFNNNISSDDTTDLRITHRNGDGVIARAYLNNTNVSFTFTLDTDLEEGCLQIRSGSGNTFNNFVIKPQLELGSSATSFVPHQEQNISIPCQQPMKSIGNVRDKFILKENGKWYERHYITRKIFDGTENWTFNESSINPFGVVLSGVTKLTDSQSNAPNCISNYFTTVAWSETVSGGKFYESEFLMTSLTDNNLRIRNNNYSTLDDFKSWLSEQYNAGTPVYVDYILKEPLDIECTSEQTEILNQMYIKAKSYKGVTHIYSNDAVSPNCYVEAVKDLTTLIQ